MVPKQCPLLRYTFWCLICCAACFGSRDNSKYHTYPLTQGTHKPTSYMTEIGFCSIVRLRLRVFSAQHPYSVWTRDGMPGMIQSGAMPFAIFANCPSSELRVDCCQYSRAFLLWALLILAVSRRALVRSRTPMILCLSNARSGDLHFGISFVALRALVREIIPNTIHIDYCIPGLDTKFSGPP